MNLRRPTAVEKTVAAPSWKTLRVSHFPSGPTAAPSQLLQWNLKPLELHYDWTKNGGQVSPNSGLPTAMGNLLSRISLDVLGGLRINLSATRCP